MTTVVSAAEVHVLLRCLKNENIKLGDQKGRMFEQIFEVKGFNW